MSAEISASDAILFREAEPPIPVGGLRPAPVVRAKREVVLRPSATRLLPFPRIAEPLPTRMTWIAVAIGVAILYFLALYSFWAPANPGVDQNGYFVGGRSFASTLSTGLKPASDYGFVGRMYIFQPETGVNYPKYPLGLPILFAACLKIFGEARGIEFAHLISPISATLAALGVFAITRRLSGGFIGVMAMLLAACGQVMVTLAINPNSHAAGTCAVVWGVFFLLRWLESGTLWRGMLAAGLFGFAYMIRYTDGLMLLPLGVAMLYATKWQTPSLRRAVVMLAPLVMLGLVYMTVAVGAELIARLALTTGSRVFTWPSGIVLAAINYLNGLPKTWHWLAPVAENHWRMLWLPLAGCAAMIGLDTFTQRPALWRLWLIRLAWLVPVAYLTIFNMVEMRAFTSYAGTNESTGFSLDYFGFNWEKMVRVVHDQGLFFVAPLGVLGLICMFRRLPLVATILTLWFLPSVLLYTAYYWAPDNMGVSYSRFVLTQLPALVIAAAWLLGEVGRRLAGANARVGRRLNLIGAPPDEVRFLPSIVAASAFGALTLAGFAAIVLGIWYYDARTDNYWWAIVVPGMIAVVVGLLALPSIASRDWGDFFDRQFARSTTRLGIACVVFASCSLGLYRTVQGNEWGQRLNLRANIEIVSRQNNNLAGLGTEVRRAVGWPKRDKAGKIVGPTDASVLMFSDGERLHHLQWIGGWQLFDVSSFYADRVNRQLWRQAADENDPDPIDPSRVKFLRALYKGKDQHALGAVQNDLIGTALSAGKRVIYVLNDGESKQFVKGLDKKRFDVKPIGSYNDIQPPRLAEEFTLPSEKPKEPVNRFGRGNAFQNQNLFAGPREFIRIGEVILKPVPPSTQPTTRKAD